MPHSLAVPDNDEASQRDQGVLGDRAAELVPQLPSAAAVHVRAKVLLLEQLPPAAASRWIWPIYLQDNGLCVSRGISCCCRITHGSGRSYLLSPENGCGDSRPPQRMLSEVRALVPALP